MNNNRGELFQVNIIRKGIEYGLNYGQIESMLDPNFMKDYPSFMSKVKESFDLGYSNEMQSFYILTNDNKDIANAFRLGMPSEQIRLLINPSNEFDQRYSHEVFLCFKNNIPIDIVEAFTKIARGLHPTVRKMKYQYTNGNMPSEMIKYLLKYADTDPDKFIIIYKLYKRDEVSMDEIEKIEGLPTVEDMMSYVWINKYHIKEAKIPELLNTELNYWLRY